MTPPERGLEGTQLVVCSLLGRQCVEDWEGTWGLFLVLRSSVHRPADSLNVLNLFGYCLIAKGARVT
jgi:hypothetical protein